MGDNKKIAKNSVILYIRLLITTVIGLYTSRIVLAQLGLEDYGLYTVVGGVVSMMGFLSTTMIATTYRFIAVEIGKGSSGDVNKVFNTSLMIHILLSLIFVVLAESIGVWYVRHHLNVSPESIPDALFVLHFSVIATVFSIVSIPFQGIVTARERFFARASIEIIRALLRLFFVLSLTLFLENKLRIYAVLMAVVMMAPSVLFYLYNRIKDRDAIRWRVNQNKSDYVKMISFSGWILIGALAHMGVRQGVAIVINVFFGTALNAAFGVSSQVYNAISTFSKNLNQAAVPQIMKSQSGGNTQRSLNLVYSMTKYTFYVMLVMSVPIALSLDYILSLWLTEVPEFTKQFVLLMLLNGLIGSLISGFDAIIQATGRIKRTQIWFSIINLLSLPISYVLFKHGCPPYAITIVNIGATVVNNIVQVKILSLISDFRIKYYFIKTLMPASFVVILALPQYGIRDVFGQGFGGFLVFSIISVLLMLMSVYFVGLSRDERGEIKRQVLKRRG